MDPIGYLPALPGQTLPPFDEAHLYEYVLAGNGLFIRSRRAGLEALIPMIVCKIAGLENVMPYVHVDQKIPLPLVEIAVSRAAEASPKEILFWLNYENKIWDLFVPEQNACRGTVVPLDPYHPKGVNALVDMHSHGPFEAIFSSTDNNDETGFRLYIVIGRGGTQIAARVGIFGQMWAIRAADICEMPAQITEYEAIHGR